MIKNKHKKLLTIIISLALISLITIGALELSSYRTRDRNVEQESFNTFQQYNISGYKISPIVCYNTDGDRNNDECRPVKLKITYPVYDSNGIEISRKGVVDKSYNPDPDYEVCINYSEEIDELSECLEYETRYYTAQELETKRDAWEDSVIATAESYLNSLDRTITEEEVIIGADVTIKDGK